MSNDFDPYNCTECGLRVEPAFAVIDCKDLVRCQGCALLAFYWRVRLGERKRRGADDNEFWPEGA